MKQLVLLYWGCVFLMYLSQIYYPVGNQLEGPQTGRRHCLLRHADIFMIIVIAWLTCFSFLRTSYNDTGNYIAGFQNAQSIVEGIANGTFTDWIGNPWSMLYRSLMHDITDNYHIYFFFPAFLCSFAVVKLCKRYSVNPALSLLIFFSIGTYVVYIAALKQCLAVFFLLMALPYAIDRKYVRFSCWYWLPLCSIPMHLCLPLFRFILRSHGERLLGYCSAQHCLQWQLMILH